MDLRSGRSRRERRMKSDTRINVGAVIGMGILLVSVMVFQSAATNARIERLDTRVDDLRSDMREDHAAIHLRLDNLQEGQSDIAQRLSHVEGRLGMPRGVDEEAAP